MPENSPYNAQRVGTSPLSEITALCCLHRLKLYHNKRQTATTKNSNSMRICHSVRERNGYRGFSFSPQKNRTAGFLLQSAKKPDGGVSPSVREKTGWRKLNPIRKKNPTVDFRPIREKPDSGLAVQPAKRRNLRAFSLSHRKEGQLIRLRQPIEDAVFSQSLDIAGIYRRTAAYIFNRAERLLFILPLQTQSRSLTHAF